MKNLISFVLFILFSIPSYGGDDPIPGFFQGNIKTLFQTAKEKNQLILIDFYTTWCVPCKKLEANVLRHPDFLPYTEKIVMYSMDAEKGEGIALADKYNVNGYPTLLVLNSDGVEIEKLKLINFEISDFLKALDQVLSGKSEIREFIAAYNSQPTFTTLYKIIDHYVATNELTKAEPFIQQLRRYSPTGIEKGDSVIFPEMIYYVISSRGGSSKDAERLEWYINNTGYHAMMPFVKGRYAQILARNDERKGIDYLTQQLKSEHDSTHFEYVSALASIRKNFPYKSENEEIEEVKLINLTKPNLVLELSKMKFEMGDTLVAIKLITDWINNNHKANLYELNSMGWHIYLKKYTSLYPSIYDRLIKKFQDVEINSNYPRIADTIACLAFEMGNKKDAIYYGKLAVEYSGNDSKSLAEYESSLKKYREMK